MSWAFVQVSEVLRSQLVYKNICFWWYLPRCWLQETVGKVGNDNVWQAHKLTAFYLWLCKLVMHSQSISDDDLCVFD